MPPTRTRPDRNRVRESLLDAAAEEFLEHGYQGTTMSRIAARAGYTKGAAYSNFEGKPALLAAACLRRSSVTTQAVAGEVTGTRDPLEIGRRLAQAAVDGSPWAQTLAEVAAVGRHDHEAASAYRHLRDAQLAAVVEQVRALDLPLRATAETSARVLQAVMSQIGLEYAVVPERWPLDEIENTLTTMVRGLLA
ncbi:TetR/AcrR family transcriptional regulator [Aestuariimicrobium soli]|uniref:TetR/AcrR family transcriptional regulator n=1 Tax=Aestuariimicrobium soli TaxID=2035834 RepID=UPI003EB88E41